MSIITLTGQFIDQRGQPLTGRVDIILSAAVFDAETGQKVLPARQSIPLDADGGFSAQLWPNARGVEESHYTLTMRGLSLRFSLPDQPAVELASVVELPG